MSLTEIATLTSFPGYCEHGSNPYIFKEFVKLDSDIQCYEKCKSKTKPKCVAFDFSPGKNFACGMYGGGPYNYGSGESGSTCYLMPIGTIN